MSAAEIIARSTRWRLEARGACFRPEGGSAPCRAGPISTIRSMRSGRAPPSFAGVLRATGKASAASTPREREALHAMGLGGDVDRMGLRRRYSDLVRKYHPDRNGGTAATRTN